MILAGLFLPRSSSFTLSASPITIFEGTNAASGNTASVTITPSGGSSPYTYAWAVEDADGTLTVANPTAATTGFNYSGLYALFDTILATVSCTVTDKYGTISVIYLTVTVSRTS